MKTYTVYRITNTANHRTYIGMTGLNLVERIARHTRALRGGYHINKEMQQDWTDGKFDLQFEEICQESNKTMAQFFETSLMNMEDNPYNIRKGNKGDMSSSKQTISKGRRMYIYDEVFKLKHHKGYKSQQIMDLFNISQPLVSMISTGFRVAEFPDTSFADVYCCEETVVKADKVKRSSCKKLYSVAK